MNFSAIFVRYLLLQLSHQQYLRGEGGGYTNEMVSMLGEAQLTVTSDCPGDQDCNDIYVTIDCHGIRQTTGGVYIGTG